MKNSSSFSTIGVIIALLVSFFALYPNILGNQKAATPAEETQAGEAAAAKAAATASTATTPVFPAFVEGDFRGARGEAGTFAGCIIKQFGVRFQFLPPATQEEILNNYSRYSQLNANCRTYKTPPPSFNFQQYVGTLLFGVILFIILFFSPLRSIIEEPDTGQTTYELHEQLAMQTAVEAVVAASVAAHLPAHVIGQNARAAALGAISTPKVPVRKYSISRIIALIGLYLIVVTFIFSSDYAFWTLFTFGDNSLFEKIIVTILLAGVAAFGPYVTNKIAEAAKPDPAKPAGAAQPEAAENAKT